MRAFRFAGNQQCRRTFHQMIPQWQWLFRQVTRQLWFRSVAFAGLGIAAALTAYLMRGLIPDDFPAKIGADSVDGILAILASSMLTVTTFSLSIMIVAFGRATQNATPRATRLLVEDRTTQNVLATFIGAFLFSLVGLVALNAGIYGGSGRVILFAATILVIAAIIVALVSWIDHLTHFGQLDETTERVEGATRKALELYAQSPSLGGQPLDRQDIPKDTEAVWSEEAGYVLYIDVAGLAKIAEKADLELYLMVSPGDFVHHRTPLIRFAGDADDAMRKRLRAVISVGHRRSFEQDPLLGFTVLSEIASRALSPGVNDPGTAIDVIGRAERLLLDHDRDRTPDSDVRFASLFVPALSVRQIFDALYDPIARDGAGIAEVQLRLQSSFRALAQTGDPELLANAMRHSRQAQQRAERAGLADHERDGLRRAALAGLP